MVIFFAIALISASLSFLLNWQSDFSISDQSFTELLRNTDARAKNIFGNLGFALAYTFVYKWFGISALLVAAFIGLIGLRITFRWKLVKIIKFLRNALFWVLWAITAIAFINGSQYSVYAGGIGFYINQWLIGALGLLGTGFLLLFSAGVYFIIRLKLTPYVWQKCCQRKRRKPKFRLLSKKLWYRLNQYR